MISEQLHPTTQVGDLADTLMVTADPGHAVLLSLFGATYQAVKLTPAETKHLIALLWRALGEAQHGGERQPARVVLVKEAFGRLYHAYYRAGCVELTFPESSDICPTGAALAQIDALIAYLVEARALAMQASLAQDAEGR